MKHLKKLRAKIIGGTPLFDCLKGVTVIGTHISDDGNPRLTAVVEDDVDILIHGNWHVTKGTEIRNLATENIEIIDTTDIPATHKVSKFLEAVWVLVTAKHNAWINEEPTDHGRFEAAAGYKWTDVRIYDIKRGK